MTEMIPGIHQLQIPIPNNPLGHTNTYLVQGDDNECLLIDPGINTDEAFDALRKGISETDTGIESITHIIATHEHGDHYGLSGRVKQLSQAKILLHQAGKDLIQSMYTNMRNHWQQMEQWLHINGAPNSDPSEIQMVAQRRPRFTAPTMPDIMLQGGETIAIGNFSISVVWTPGHARGHVCIYESTKKLLFSGDHVLPVITPNVSLQPHSDLNPLGDFVNSLNKVKKLDVNLVLPAHEHIFTDLPKRVDEIIQHHEYRNSEILDALKDESKTAYQISQKITWMPTLGGVSFLDLAPWDKRSAVSETLAHLEAMRIEGRVDKFTTDSIIYYQCA